jgi:hypothetical protein
MKMNKEYAEIINESSFPGEPEIEELDILEENEEIYKWLSLLLGIIWILSLIVF